MSGETIILPPASIAAPGGRALAAPFQFLVSGEDNLRVKTWATVLGANLIVSGRMVDATGKLQVFNFSYALDSSGVGKTQVLGLAPGYVLSVSAEVDSTNVQRGQCFVKIDLVRGLSGALTTLGTLIQGYVASFVGRAYPGSLLEQPSDGNGHIRAVSGPAPAPGHDISFVPPIVGQFRLLSFRAFFQASAVAATRAVYLYLQDQGGTTWFTAPAANTQSASQGFGYNFTIGVTDLNTLAIGEVGVPIPSYRLVNGGTFNTLTGGLQAGDQWGAPTVIIEEWITPWS
jgi:hypothetical protein